MRLRWKREEEKEKGDIVKNEKVLNIGTTEQREKLHRVTACSPALALCLVIVVPINIVL